LRITSQEIRCKIWVNQSEQLIELLRLALTLLARRGLATPEDLRLLAEMKPRIMAKAA
jgi:hypothetical protein